MKRTRIIAAGVVVLAVGSAAVTMTAQASIRPPAVHAPAPVVGCATYDVAGQPSTGLPWDEPVTFCGPGVRTATWTCPAKTPDLGPGSTLHCTRQP